MQYVVVEIGGSQYKVAVGNQFSVDKIEGKKGDLVKFEQVLLSVDGEKIDVGTPYLKDIQVQARIINQIRGPKIRVATYKAKSRYRRVKGHRQAMTLIEIEKIVTAKLTSGKTKK